MSVFAVTILSFEAGGDEGLSLKSHTYCDNLHMVISKTYDQAYQTGCASMFYLTPIT